MATAAQLRQLHHWLLGAGEPGATQRSEAEMIDLIGALEELKGVAAAAQARLTAHLYAARQAREAADRVRLTRPAPPTRPTSDCAS